MMSNSEGLVRREGHRVHDRFGIRYNFMCLGFQPLINLYLFCAEPNDES